MVSIRNFTQNGSLHTRQVILLGQPKQLTVKLTESQMPEARDILNDVGQRMEREPITGKLAAQLGIKDPAAVKAIIVDGELPPDTKRMNDGTIETSTDVARKSRGPFTALGCSGGGIKAAYAHTGSLFSIEEHGMEYHAIGGASGGSIAAVSNEAIGDSIKAYRVFLGLLKRYDMLDLLDPFPRYNGKMNSFAGLFRGEKISRMLREHCALERIKIEDLRRLVIVALTELNSGRDFFVADPKRIKGAMVEDIESASSSERAGKIVEQKYVPNLLAKIPLYLAVKASGSLPGVFDPIMFADGGRDYDLSDGGQVNNLMQKLMASLIDYDKFLFLETGYAGQNEGMYRLKNFLAILLHSIDIMMSVQKSYLNEPIFHEDISVRCVNYGQYNISSFDLGRGHEMMIGSRETMDCLFGAFMKGGVLDANAFWSMWKDSNPEVKELLGRFYIKRIGGSASNVLYLTDQRSLTMDPNDSRREEYFAKDGGFVATKEANAMKQALFLALYLGSLAAWSARKVTSGIIGDGREKAEHNDQSAA